MRAFISLTTAAAFWLHVVLGCCAHHAHASEGSGCAHAFASCGSHQHDEDVCAEHADDAHQHADESSPCGEISNCDTSDESLHDAGDDDCSPVPHQHNDCHESHCSVIVKVESTAIAKALIAEFARQLADGSYVAMQATNLDRSTIDPSDGVLPPIALYLAQQTLLL